MLGAVSIVFSVQQIVRQLGVPSASLARAWAGDTGKISWLGVLSGMGSGFTSMIAHAGSPPFQFYVMPKRLDRDMCVGTSVLFFCCDQCDEGPGLFRAGPALDQPAQDNAHLCSAGHGGRAGWASAWCASIDVRKFNVVITIILIAVSLLLIAQGVSGFMAARAMASGT